jgi:AcrR family transcriptional regulator
LKLKRNGPSRRGSAETTVIVEGSREDRLLDALRDLMVERDSLDVTLGEVAARAGVNHGLVGYYFGSKEGMFVALMLRHAAGTPRQLNALMRSSMSPVEKMRVHIAGVVRSYEECPILGILLDHILNTGSREAVAQVDEIVVTPMLRFYEAILDEGVQSGDFVKMDAMFLHMIVIGACTALYTNRPRLKVGYGISQITPTFQRRYLEYVTDFILRAMRKSDSVSIAAVPDKRAISAASR